MDHYEYDSMYKERHAVHACWHGSGQISQAQHVESARLNLHRPESSPGECRARNVRKALELRRRWEAKVKHALYKDAETKRE